MTRREVMDAFAAAGVTVPGAEWSTDQRIEAAFSAWHAAGAPRCAFVCLEYDRTTGKEVTAVKVPADDVPVLE